MGKRITRREFLKTAGILGALSLTGLDPLTTGAGNAVAAEADVIVKNGRFATMNPRMPFASAVAVREGRFLAVGDETEVMRHMGPGTIVVDVKGRTAIPGLIDSHIHTIRGGLNYNMELRWDGVPSLADAMRMLREQARRTPPPQWVRVVGGFSQFQFAEKRLPTLEELNEAAPETPVFILHLYDRALLNRAALRAAGYTKDTPDPPGAGMQRDRNGAPTGLFIAAPNAYILYATLAKGPTLSYQDRLNSSRQFMRELNRLGVTSCNDPGGGFQNYPEDYEIIRDLARGGQLTTRIAYNLFTQKPKQELEDYRNWMKMVQPGDGDDFYRMNGAGEMLVFSAADFEQFFAPRPDLSVVMEEDLKKVIRLLAENRWPFRLHATYDESITRFLNVFDDVNRDVPLSGTRWFFDHAETISERNIARVKALSGGIAVQHRMAYQGEAFMARYGAAKAAESPPIRKIIREGIPIGAGTDATRVASYNPWVALYWLVTGKTAGGTSLYPESNRLDRAEALRLYTAGSAWFSNEEGKKGTIEPGRLADLAVLSADYFSVPEERIKDIQSVLTVVGGKVVHASAEFVRLAPPPLPVSPDWSPVRTYGGYHTASPYPGGAAACCTAPKGGHNHQYVLGSTGDLWEMGCDCFVP